MAGSGTKGTRRGATAIVMIVVGVAACSSGSGVTGNQKHDISAFRAIVDNVCAGSNAAFASIRQQYQSQFVAGAPTEADARDFLVRLVLPEADKLVGSLHDAGEPTLDRSTWDSIMRDVDAQLSDLKAAANRDPVGTLKSEMQVRTTQSALERRFDAFGTKECGKPS